MIIIRLKGGMGNQMFQYALGLQLAQLLNTTLRIDLSSLLDRSRGDFVYRNYDLSIFNLEAEFVTAPAFLKTIYKLKSSGITRLVRNQINKGRDHIKEQHFHFQPEILSDPKDNAIYEGWFQSYRYFEGIGALLRKEFAFKDKVVSTSQPLLEKIKTSNAVCLNVRRTDFLKVDNLNTTNQNYFLEAAAEIAKRVKDPVFYIFSDDVEWCREHIRLEHPRVVVDHSHKGHKFGNYMQLMIACKHYIIPNSSFAWWAVWLNQNASKFVVAPKNWFNDQSIDTSDLIPENWLRI